MARNSVYLGIVLRVFDDFCAISPLYVTRDALRDQNTVRARYKAEGHAFVSKTLPALGKHFEKSLAQGTFEPMPAFKRATGRTTPAFLGSLFKEVFDATGTINGTPSVEAVRLIRQACYVIYKLEDEFSDSIADEALRAFEATDRDLRQCEVLSTDQKITLDIANSICRGIFAFVDFEGILPRPGPGSTACGTHPALRYEPHVRYSNIDEIYKYADYFYCHTEHVGAVGTTAEHALPNCRDGVSKVRLVNKEYEKPRIICMEPHEYMWFQQGMGSLMRETMQHHPLTAGHVNFDDQSVNQALALQASVDGYYATLDMSEASDRISRPLVAAVFDGVGAERDGIDLATRLVALSNRRAQLPDGRVIELNKFAPMGSSLCFPTMSLVHFALAVALISRATLLPIKAIAKEVYVYGDDIIVPARYAHILFKEFPIFGLKFNQGKSFVSGHFRESCGMDAFRGENVTPVRLKSRFLDPGAPSERAKALLSAQAVEWGFRSKGYHTVAKFIRESVESQWGEFPRVTQGSAVCGWIDDPAAVARQFSTVRGTTDQKSQSIIYRQRCFAVKPDVMMIDSWERLLRAYTHVWEGSKTLTGRRSDKCIVWRQVHTHAFFAADSILVNRIDALVSHQGKNV